MQWFTNQVLVNVGLHLESQLTDAEHSAFHIVADPLAGADVGQSRKRKDLDWCAAVSEAPRPKRRVQGRAAREEAAAAASASAMMPATGKHDYQAVCNAKYIEASRGFFAEEGRRGDISMCADASRLGGHETLVAFAADPHSGHVVVLPPQARCDALRRHRVLEVGGGGGG